MTNTPFVQLVPEKIFEAIETYTGKRCTGRYLQLNAMENRVYRVDIEDEAPVVAKFYRPGRWSKDTILSEHRFLGLCEKNEVPVVTPLLSEESETLREISGIFYTVFPYRPGRLEPELSEEQLKRLGRFLARIHQVGEAMPGEPRPKLTPQTYGRDAIAKLSATPHFPDLVRQRFEQIIESMAQAMEGWFSKFPSILVHGDCHSGNLLWKDSAPYFIDFDDMVYAPPVQDLWMLTGGEDEDGKKRKEIVLDAYLELRDFDENSLKLIESLRVLRILHFNAWIAERWADESFPRAFPAFGSERYWQEQWEAVYVGWEKIQNL